MITLDKLDLKNISPHELGQLLLEAKKAYYTSGKPIMDDHTYDTLEEILRQKAPHHRFFTKIGTPNFDTGFDKKKHLIPMGSQNKVNTFKDLVHYFELKNIILNKKNSSPSLSRPSEARSEGGSKEGAGGWIVGFVVQPKCDGISLEIIYKNAQLVEAITRGDGFTGDVITQNVVKMKNLPLSLPRSFSGSIRCEIVVTKKDFEKLNEIVKNSVLPLVSKRGLRQKSEGEIENEGVYSNPRNAASGLSQRLDGKYCEFCTLYATDVLSNTEGSQPFRTEIEKISFLKSLDFVPVESHLCQSLEEVEKIYQRFLTKDRLNYPYEIDGLVIKINDLDIAEKLGSKNNRPKFQVAYKFPASTSFTQIKNIIWQVGPLGTVTPVAELEPVEIAGAIISFASLGNYKLITEKNINLGDIVEITRRGDVIPHVERVINKVTKGHIDIPQYCPSCQSPLIKEDKYLRCPNSKNCLSQILGSLRLFADSLDILGLSDKTIEKLYSAGKVKNPGDFYNLKISDLSNLENLGEKSARNIINQIQSKKTLSLSQIFTAAAIPNLSRSRIQQLIKAGFNTPEKLLNITIDEIEKLPGFQKTLADKVWQGIQLRKEWVKSILTNVETQSLRLSDGHSPSLQNLTFAITGDLSEPRPKFIELIEAHGGKVVTTVSKNTDYLLTNETNSTSNKFQLAKKYNVKIINEATFNKLVNSHKG